mmetsp:Transcript_17554/g.24195  ORF Transcript_17554/g.24195 Transcript_17554/m.24195 type:complete len:87 (+) Transcript_17554:74-334(+)
MMRQAVMPINVRGLLAVLQHVPRLAVVVPATHAPSARLPVADGKMVGISAEVLLHHVRQVHAPDYQPSAWMNAYQVKKVNPPVLMA